MSTATEARLSELDAVLDSLGDSESLSADLFGVVDALDSSASLRRALTDPNASETARQSLVHTLLDGKVSEPAVRLVSEAVGLRWSGGRTLAAALERQGVRAELARADAAGEVDDTEDALFRFARLVESSPDLRNALANRRIGLAHRRDLVSQLLEGRATASTVTLARRAVAARERTFGNTIEGFITLAAAQKSRVVATVRVARSLTPEQHQRLRTALSSQVGRDVVIQEVIDESVIGGVRVELGSEVIEGTVGSRLEDARRLFG